MKANAPEKIYVKITHPISDEYTEIIAFKDGDGIEYIHTDAFIEKAVEWLECNNTLPDGEVSDYIEEFKKAMKLWKNIELNTDTHAIMGAVFPMTDISYRNLKKVSFSTSGLTSKVLVTESEQKSY